MGLLELTLRNEVLHCLRAIAFDLLLREREPRLGGLKGGARSRHLLLGVERVEARNHLALAHGIAQAHTPLDQLAADTERHGIRIARRDFHRIAQERARLARGTRMHGDRYHRDGQLRGSL